MTREEAINKLVNARYADEFQGDEELTEARLMAIQALSQEPCDDTVSIRKDVLKCRVGKLVAYNVEWLKKHWQMEMDIVCGVKPCDDAISRDFQIGDEVRIIGSDPIRKAVSDDIQRNSKDRDKKSLY